MKRSGSPCFIARLACLLGGALLGGAGCIKVPDVVIVDRKTALEEQAAGRFDGLGDELAQAGLTAGPVPYTRGELEAAGVPVGKGDEALGRGEAVSDGEIIDELLVRRCVGEALDGRLVDTPRSCTQPIDPAKQAGLLERANRRRFQIWRYLGSKQPSLRADVVRAEWRRVHLASVVCGGQVQKDDGSWEPKAC